MQTRRDFIGLMPFASATLLGACGGGESGGDASASSVSSASASVPSASISSTSTVASTVGASASDDTLVAAGAKQAPSREKEDKVPAFVVVEDWSSGSAVDAGRIDFNTLIRQDGFADKALSADCAGWTEHGPSAISTLPVLNGVQFSAKRFTIAIGGIYKQTSHRVLVMMRAIGLRDGLFGDIAGVSTFAGPHKLRITTASGVELKRIEMRDGLPINHPSLVNVPLDWTVTNRLTGGAPDVQVTAIRLANNKAMRPHMSAGSCYLAFFGDEPASSDAVRNKIPRVKTQLWPSKNSKFRAIYNGDDLHLTDARGYSGNGNAHPEVMPRWAMSYDEVSAVSTVVKDDREITGGQGYNWANALRVGWDYEPGALGGITRRGGPGGVRMDRTTLPGEIFQMALTQTVRTNDGTPTASMARGYALNHANYPGYYPRSMLTLDAINTLSDTPQPNVPGNAINPVRHYYGSNGSETTPGAVFIYDIYGGNAEPMARAIEWANPGTGTSRSNANHPRNGWMPDAEHNNRCGTAWATLLYSDPLFCRMAEHMMMFESQIGQPLLPKGTWAISGSNPAGFIDAPGNFWASRSNVLPLCTAAMMWWIASQQGVYTRADIESSLKELFKRIKLDVLDVLPARAANAGQKGFQLNGMHAVWGTWEAGSNYAAGEGWVSPYPISMMYVGHLFAMMKSSGLYDVLMADANSAAVLSGMQKSLEFNARMFKDVPWAMCAVYSNSLGTAMLLRTAAAGAVQSDIGTVPSNYAETLSYNRGTRTDDFWFLSPTGIPGTSAPAFNSTYSAHGRMQPARMWWDLLCPRGTERDAGLAVVEQRIQKLAAYTPTFGDPCFTRHNAAFSIPALS